MDLQQPGGVLWRLPHADMACIAMIDTIAMSRHRVGSIMMYSTILKKVRTGRSRNSPFLKILLLCKATSKGGPPGFSAESKVLDGVALIDRKID